MLCPDCSPQHLHDQNRQIRRAGGNCKGGTNHAAAAPSKCAAIALLICPSAKPLDGYAICSWWFCTEPDEVRLLRGELAWLPRKAGTVLLHSSTFCRALKSLSLPLS